MTMANSAEKKTGAFGEKPSAFKTAFQYATAFMYGLTGDNMNLGFQQAGMTYDYAKAYVGSKKQPKL
jgi:hypothetical protein